MKKLIPALVLSVLSAQVWADTEAVGPENLKSGDQVSFTFKKYVQDTPGSTPVLEDRTASSSYAIESGSDAEILVRYKNGVTDVLDKDLAFIASINKAGVRKTLPADAVKHWMPKSGLRPGMKWSFENHWESSAANDSFYKCRSDGEFDARSSASEREVKINGKLVRLPVTVVEIEGKTRLQVCQGSMEHSRERYEYSRDLHLVIEHEYIEQDSYGKLYGGWLQTVTAVTTKAPL